MKYNMMQYLHEYLNKLIIQEKNKNIEYSYDIYNPSNPFNPYKSFKQSENINRFLIQKLIEIDQRLENIENKLK